MSEKKMTDAELAKISGAGEKTDRKTDSPPEIIPPDGGGEGGTGHPVDGQTPGTDPADLDRA
mgnify:CR=1 FL=1